MLDEFALVKHFQFVSIRCCISCLLFFQKALCYYMVTNTASACSLFSQDGIDIVILTQKCSCIYMHTSRLSLFTEMCEMFLYYMPTTRLSLFT